MDRQTFWDHAEVLRGVLLRIAAVIVVLVAVFFAAMPRMFDSVIMAPCRPDFPLYALLGLETSEVSLVNIQLASQFFIHMTASLYMALATAFPVVLFMLWGFVAPGLYENERRGVAPAFAGACVMFFAGVAAGYFLVFPLTLRFLADYQLWLLGRIGVINRRVFTLYRRHAIVALLVLAAVVTPSGDPFTLLVVFTPVYILWELSALAVPAPATSISHK